MKASAEIFVENADPKTRFPFKLTLCDAGGQPLPAKDVLISVEGDGSLQQGHNAKTLTRETNASGEVEFSWFRRSIFGRDAKAVVSVEPRDLPDAQIKLEATELDQVNTSYRTKIYPLKVGGRNIYR